MPLDDQNIMWDLFCRLPGITGVRVGWSGGQGATCQAVMRELSSETVVFF